MSPEQVIIEENAKLLKQLETAMHDMKTLAGMVSDAYTRGRPPKKCTRPDCNCIDIAEKRNGGPVKSYQCLADISEDVTMLKSSKRPTPEAVAVAWDWWKVIYGWKIASVDKDSPRASYYVNAKEDKAIPASELFTLFTASPEYKELTK